MSHVGSNIDQDKNRFKDIVKGKVRDDLKDYLSNKSITGQQGKKKVKIPLPKINLPRFRFDDKKDGGVGQGEGEPGDPIRKGKKKGQGSGQGAGQGGDGEHTYSVEIDINELAEILGEELSLPNIEPKGESQVEAEDKSYNSIRDQGPQGLARFKRSYKEALKRQVASGTYDPKDPVIIPRREDFKYLDSTVEPEPEFNALAIFMMDVSGSMASGQKDIVQDVVFWIDAWLSSQYDGLENRFIVHSNVAEEVSRDDFFRISSGGGTKVIEAYKLCRDIIENEYSYENWNIYPFHFSDGDDWDLESGSSVKFVDEEIIDICNLFCYGQVESMMGSGALWKQFKEAFKGSDKYRGERIDNSDDIDIMLETFFGE